MPEGAVYVGRPTRWGNTYRADEFPPGSMRDPVGMYEHDCALAETFTPARFEKWIAPLRGKSLVCWCRLDQRCHADVLLELANAAEPHPVPTPQGET